MKTTMRKQPTESELRDLLFDSYLLGHMSGSQPLPFSVAAYEPTANQLLALRAAMAKGVLAHRHMLSTACAAPPVDLTRLLTKEEVAKEVEHLLGQKLVDLVACETKAKAEEPNLAVMTSPISTTQEIPPSRLAVDVDPVFFLKYWASSRRGMAVWAVSARRMTKVSGIGPDEERR